MPALLCERNKVKKKKYISWHGTKGLWISAHWCREMKIILENMHVSEFRHWDLWLGQRQRTSLLPSVHLCKPLGGYGHRVSQTARSAEQTYGGAWLPENSKTYSGHENYLLECSPPAVKNWVQECRKISPNIERGDVAPVPLQIPIEGPGSVQLHGVYSLSSDTETSLLMEIPLDVSSLMKPGSRFVCN